MSAPPAVAAMPFASKTEEWNVVVKTPLPFVVPDAPGVKPLPLPPADTVTGAPPTRLPNRSFTVTVTRDAWMPATQENEHCPIVSVAATTLESAASTPSDATSNPRLVAGESATEVACSVYPAAALSTL